MKPLTVVEETVMLAIYRLKGQAYSVTIHQEIMTMTGKDMILGTLFNTLKQLHGKNYVQKTKAKPPTEKGGKDVLLYNLTKEGLDALEQTRSMNARIWDQIPETL